jgi:E3 UFM1-protein ligase 1
MEEIYEMLADQGQILIQELTTKYNLPLEFLKDCVASKLESHLPPGS